MEEEVEAETLHDCDWFIRHELNLDKSQKAQLLMDSS